MSFCYSLAVLAFTLSAPDNAQPRITDDRLVIELVARQPDIVTPTGLTVDEQGRLWVIENHTHQRTAAYKGHPSDRIRVFSDPGPDGTFGKVTTYADGFKNAMSIALGRDGIVYLATRSDVWQLRDTKGRGQADQRKVIVKLDSPGDYPHNGLAGFAFDGLGGLYFALGENLGAHYKLIGSDGTSASGGGEGGSIYRCAPDGSKLERFATGFWNTFHLTFDGFGRLFAVDNDPDSRGPCRLLHIVQGGDYGYRFRNGRRGLHPFTAWNGELPGTLPMVAGTGEAPSGILAYESNGLPTEYRGKLLVTSWGDHVVEQFTLTPRGASFGAKSSVLVRGGENFRPVAIATGPDGSLYLSDWVDKSYPVHGKGAIWRIRRKERPKDDGLRPSKVIQLTEPSEINKLLGDPRREIRQAATDRLSGWARSGLAKLKETLKQSPDPRTRLAALWGIARFRPEAGGSSIEIALEDPAPEVRAEAARQMGQMDRLLADDSEHETGKLLPLAIKDASPYVRMQAILQLRKKTSLQAILPILADSDPFLSAAALEVLGRTGNVELLTNALDSKDAHLRLGILLALRRGGTEEGRKLLSRFLGDADPGVRRAAVQWVAEERLKEYKDAIAVAAAREPVTRQIFEALLAAQALLPTPLGIAKTEPSGEEFVAPIVKDAKQPAVFRTLGLRMLRPDHPVLTKNLLQELLSSPERALRNEAVRTLALRSDDASQQMLRQLAQDGTAENGQRAFAILGLAHSAATSAETRRLLLALLSDAQLRRDALRSLRGLSLSEDERQKLFAWWDALPLERGVSHDRRELAAQLLLIPGVREDERARKLTARAGPQPTTEEEWQRALTAGGDAAAGERVFLHVRGPRCAVCHRIDGRGGQVGPELSAIARSHDRAKLIESILKPSKEIAPAFTNWVITMRDGKTYTGVIISENFDSTITLGDADGKRHVLKRFDIEERQASPKSLMPDDLHRLMTRLEFRDLLEYLRSTRSSP